MKVLRRNGQQAPASGSGAKSAAGAGTGPPTVPGTTGSSSSRPGIKIVSRAAQPPKPTYTGPSPEEVESRKVAELLLRLVLDLSASADADVSAAAADDNNSNIFEICDGANDVAAVVALAGLSFLQSTGLLTALAGEVQDGEEAEGREAALLGLKQLCGAVGRACEPYLVPLLPLLLERLMDKAPAVRQAAGEAAQSLAGALCPQAVKLALPSELQQQSWGLGELEFGRGLQMSRACPCDGRRSEGSQHLVCRLKGGSALLVSCCPNPLLLLPPVSPTNTQWCSRV